MDATWYKDVNNFAVHTAWLHGFMKVYAVYGVGIFAVLVLLGWWFARSQANPPRAVASAIWAAAGTIIAVGINQIIANAVARPRPYLTLHHVEVLVARSTDYSFPSDHTITAGAAVTGLWIIAHYSGRATRALAVVGTILSLFLAFARVYVGAHYPGDVAGGLVIGTAISLIGWLILRAVLTLAVDRIGTYQPLRPFVFAAAGTHRAAHAAPRRAEPATSSRPVPDPGRQRQP